MESHQSSTTSAPRPALIAKPKRLVLHPVIEDTNKLRDLMCRLAWYITPAIEAVEEIIIPVSCPIDEHFEVLPDFDPAIGQLLGTLIERVRFMNESAESSSDKPFQQRDSDIVYVWNSPNEKESESKLKRLRSKLSKGAVINIDNQHSRNEGSLFLWSVHNHLIDFKQARANNQRAFNEFLAQSKAREKSRAYVFGTGPTLSLETSHDYSDGDCIISNSMVRNLPLLERLKPIAVVAGDPIFHAGCSSYAAEFRDALVIAMRKFPMTLFVPARDEAVYAANLPEDLQSRMIAIPFGQHGDISLDLSKEFAVNPAPNVLTLLLLPLAASLHNRVSVVGCDGRPKNENSYFWSHDPKSQFVDHMEAIKRVHPAFFEIDYQDYYDTHCETLENYFQHASTQGCRIDSITPSFIPALQSRQLPIADSMSDEIYQKTKPVRLISIDPDTISDHGHFLAYSEAMKDTCDNIDTPMHSLVNTQASKNILSSKPYLTPCLSIHSWTLSADLAHPNSDQMRKCEAELESAITKITEQYPDEDLCLYMYCGSLAHAACIANVIKDKPNCRATVNLFWESARPEQLDHLGPLWKDFVDSIEPDSRLKLTIPTQNLGDVLRSKYNWNLQVAPHPSPTVQDRHIPSLPQSAASKSQKLNVLFPGSQRLEKGFQATVEYIESLSGNSIEGSTLEFTVRYYETKGTPKELRHLLSRLSKHANIIDGQLDRDAFLNMFHDKHAVVLPYHSDAFQMRTSGLLIDAVMCLVPVIVLKDTWMASVVKSTGCGIIIDDMTPKLLNEALREISQNHNHYTKCCRKLRDHYATENNWKVLVRSALSMRLNEAPVPSTPSFNKQPRSKTMQTATPQAAKPIHSTPKIAPPQTAPTQPNPAMNQSRNLSTIQSKRSHYTNPTSPGIGHINESKSQRAVAHAKLSRLISGPFIRRAALVGVFCILTFSAVIFALSATGTLTYWVWPALSIALLSITIIILLKWTILVHGTAWSLERRLKHLETKLHELPIELDSKFANISDEINQSKQSILEDLNKVRNQNMLAETQIQNIQAKHQADQSATSDHIKRIHEHQSELIETQNEIHAQIERLGIESKNDQHKALVEIQALSSRSDSLTALNQELEEALSDHQSENREAVDTIRSITDRSESLIEHLQSQLHNTNERIDTVVQEAEIEQPDWPYIRFNRTLSDEQTESISTDWASKLGVHISPDTLNYRVRKLHEMEAFLDGRLAATAADLMARCMAVEGAIARCNQDKPKFLEIGTLFGINALFIQHCISSHTPDLQTTLIDPLDGYYGNEKPDVLTGIPVSEKVLRNNILRWNSSPKNFKIIKSISEDPETITRVCKERFDAILIDGDHSKQGVENDYTNYAQAVAIQGCLIFDDYDHPSWPDVKEVVDSMVEPDPRFTRLGIFGTTAIYQRTKE